MRVIIFSFHRDCASKVMRKDWQTQEAVRFALSSMKNNSRMKLDQEMKLRKALLKQKEKGAMFPSCLEALTALNQGTNLILNFTDWLFSLVADTGTSELSTGLEIGQDCWNLGRSLFSSSRTMSLFSYVLCSYPYGSTASTWQCGVTEFYLSCTSNCCPKMGRTVKDQSLQD